MAFDREAHVAAGRQDIRNSLAAFEKENRNRPLTSSTVKYLIDRQMDGVSRLEADLQLANEWIAELRALKGKLKDE